MLRRRMGVRAAWGRGPGAGVQAVGYRVWAGLDREERSQDRAVAVAMSRAVGGQGSVDAVAGWVNLWAAGEVVWAVRVACLPERPS